MARRWLTTVAYGHDVHCIPLEDLIEHRESVDCFCSPGVSFLDVQPHGTWQYLKRMVTHQAMDGRE